MAREQDRELSEQQRAEWRQEGRQQTIEEYMQLL